ncbi:hypothetical protein LTR86_006285 [Recurvomyces mirabilis]|nr:hypothetical protein LTR86_006285 [Recurvomyces mirabilis]
MAEISDEATTAGAIDSNHDRTSDDTPNKFQQAISAWRHLSFSTLITTLDTTASDLVAAQQASLTQRKDLAQKTKDFRKLDDPSKLVEIKDLLKAYQGYVDLLTKQSQSVQTAFMKVYDPLSDVPDPYPLLEASVEALVTADEVVPRLEGENEALKKQVTKLEGVLEDSEGALEVEREKRMQLESEKDEDVREAQGKWERIVREQEENWAAKEAGLESKVEGLEGLVRELKAGHEVEMRLGRSGADEGTSAQGSATQAELDIVNSELERTNVRLVDLEARNETLRVELAQSVGQSQSSGRGGAVEDEPAFLRLRTENQSLMRKLDSARSVKDSEKSGIDAKLRSLEREINALKIDRDSLQARVKKWSDYEEVKRELEMLRAVEFAGAEDDEDERESDHTNGSAKEGTLEHLLITRNKKLSNDLTELRVSHNELLQRLEILQEQTSEANMELEQTRNLNATLENDLLKTQREASNAFETMSVAGTYTSRYPKSAYGSRRGGGASPTSSIIGGFEPSASISGGTNSPRGAVGLDALRAGEASAAGGTGILPMVTAQRDRFKKKIGEVEQELAKQYQTVSSLRSEVASLQKDNLDLYEKTRYVSSYAGSHQRTGAGSGVAYGGNPNPSTIAVGEGSGTSERYRSAYEQNLSPFAAFRGRESARAMKRMSLPERAVFQLSRIVLATRTSRNLFALYCLGLHLLVLIMLFWMGTADAEVHGSHLGASAAAGAAAAVKGAADHGDWKAEGFKAGG